MQQDALEAWQRRADGARGEVLPIVTVDDPDHQVLRVKAKLVRHVNRRVRELLRRMEATMYAAKGVGLAAPQVGISQRLIVVDAGVDHCALVNPEVVSSEGSQLEPLEGCLSIPGVTGEVERAGRVRVKALDLEGHETWIDAEGYFARVIQHEIDHLDGILFTDRARRIIRPTAESKLKVAFLGSAGFGAAVLEGLLEADVVPMVVITQPDRPAGRGLRPVGTPVKEVAMAADIEVQMPEKVRDPGFVRALAERKPDVIVTAAYGQIIPKAMLDLPRLGAINVHPSLLPRYRGPDPIRRALWNGEAETGVTILYMSTKVDAGDMLAQEKVAIDPEDDGLSLSRRLAPVGTELLRGTLRDLALGRAKAIPQDEAQVTMAPKIAPAEEVVDWSLPATLVIARARALSPRPGLHTADGLKFFGLVADGETQGQAPGTVIDVGPDGLRVATGAGVVRIERVQPPGKRVMGAADYARGHHLIAGSRLGQGGQG